MNISKNKRYFLSRDLGMLLFLASIFIASIILLNSSEVNKFESVIMLLIMLIAITLAAYDIYGAAVVLVGLQLVIFTSYKLFFYYTRSEKIEIISYLWLFIPMISVAGMIIYSRSSMRIDLANKLLRKQIERFNLVDPLTGLYNLKALIADLNRMMSLTRRNKTSFTLMVVGLRHGNEIKTILSKNDYDILKQRMASLIQSSLRLEDRVYAIDDASTLAIILTCNQEGGEAVYSKVKSILENDSAFGGIVDRAIKVQVRIAYKEYDIENTNFDGVNFKKRVENELQYDV